MFKKQSELPAASTFRAESDPRPPKGTSVLGPTLTFKGGELSVDEDLIIEGTVEGKIAHQNHHLTIGKNGRVKADVKARLITVYGTIEGNLHGDEGVQVMASARVVGNVVAPRVSIETGARFEGSITTKDAPSVAARAAAPETPRGGSVETPRTASTETPSFAKLGSGGR
ncbi:MAG TPA: polymer-forming cytoskeletal protein [Gammaproteobacteria bacterium]|nr:polymer-forming cytoskeletal protein [Gammaproteobacteria bacterium]